ncbi:MAG: hypothetical protein Q9209_000361 [Squamulea sp. 1 TL-2023]
MDFSIALAELDFIDAIRDWGRSPHSQALWLQGNYQENYSANANTIAAKVITTVRDMAIPFLGFFFIRDDDDYQEDLQRRTSSPCKGQEEAMAVDFIYSLIRQLINQLPCKVKLSGKNWRKRFKILDGSLQTCKVALRILEELLDHAPATLLIIIDGVEQVERSEGEALVAEVLQLLQRITTDSNERVIKVLYTTAGPSDALEDLDEDFLEIVEASEGRPKHMKGRLEILEELHFDSDSMEED